MYLRWHTAAAVFIAVFLSLLLTAGSALAATDDAGVEQYTTTVPDQQVTTAEPQAAVTQEAEVAPAVEYHPATTMVLPAQYSIDATPADSGSVPATPAPGAAAPNAAGMSSKIFMLLGSAAAATSMLASGMAIIRGRK